MLDKWSSIATYTVVDARVAIHHNAEAGSCCSLRSVCALSIPLTVGSGKERFYFENPQVCMVYNAGELTLIEYGRDEVLGSCRTEHMNPHLISVRMHQAKRQKDEDVKRVGEATLFCI